MADALREIAAKFGISFDGTPLEQGIKRINETKDALVKLSFEINQISEAFRLVLGNSVGRAIDFVRDFEEDAGRLEDTANALNLTTKELQEMEVAATRAGLRTQQFDAAMQRFQQSVEAAAQGGSAQSAVFERLGIKVKDASGQARSSSALMTELAGAFDRVSDPAQRARMATELFGRAGARIATILRSGEGGLEQLRGELQELGGGLSQDAIVEAGKFGDELDRLKVSSDSLRSSLAVVLLPAVTWVTDKIRNGIVYLVKLSQTSSILQAAIALVAVAVGKLALVLIGSLWPALAPAALAALPWLLLGLAIEDVITFFRGGKSVVGEVIAGLLGAKDGAEALKMVKEAGEAAWGALKLIWKDIQEFSDDVLELGESIGNALMGALDRAGNWISAKVRWIADKVNAASRFLGLGNVIDTSTTNSPASARAAGNSSAPGVVPPGGSAPVARVPSFLLGPEPVLGASRSLLAPATVQSTVMAPIHVHGITDPGLFADRVQRHVAGRQRDQVARAHAARRDVAGG